MRLVHDGENKNFNRRKEFFMMNLRSSDNKKREIERKLKIHWSNFSKDIGKIYINLEI